MTNIFAAPGENTSRSGLDERGISIAPADSDGDEHQVAAAAARLATVFPRSGSIPPNPESAMLAPSVMFDLRPIAARQACSPTCRPNPRAAEKKLRSSISHHDRQFRSSITAARTVPRLRHGGLGRAQEQTIDLKHNGVVPVVDHQTDLRAQGQLARRQTPARASSPGSEAGAVSTSGGRDLTRRLRHDRRHPPRPPGRPDPKRGDEARQFHGARRSLRFRAGTPPSLTPSSSFKTYLHRMPPARPPAGPS